MGVESAGLEMKMIRNCLSNSRRRKSLVAFIFATSLVVFMWIQAQDQDSDHPNYFMDTTKYENIGYILSTSTCKIYNLSPWDRALKSLLTPERAPTDCSKESDEWTYVNGTTLVINTTSLSASGYNLGSVQCCYRAIARVEQTMDNYDVNADNDYSMTEDCINLKQVYNEVAAEFVRVQCYPTRWLGALLRKKYVNYHAFVRPSTSPVTVGKIVRWENATHLPPNVLLLGMDSISRLNFHRTMPKTAGFLRDIGAFEMLGYTKVGENTYPNAAAFLTGYSKDELSEGGCKPELPQDYCPYIWKRFNRSSYLTAHAEDSPRLCMFNYLKLGFVKQQVDFYLRPFMQAIYGRSWTIDCIGPSTVDSKMLRYIERLLTQSRNVKAPLFLLSWMTNLAHDNHNNPIFADDEYYDFLRRVNLDSTILFFMSDHGRRFGKYRETDHGWFEDKLPNFWVYLPTNLRDQRPSWVRSLETNRRRLSSPYDLYKTLEHILSEFTTEYSKAKSPKTRNGTVINRRFGQSFFQEIPANRTCTDAGIGDEYCACDIPHIIPLESPSLKIAAETAIKFLNEEKLPSECARLSLNEITAGASTESRHEKSTSWNYIVAFTTEPGGFLFEAVLKYEPMNRTYVLAKRILRMNSISRQTDCVFEPELEMFCYCL